MLSRTIRIYVYIPVYCMMHVGVVRCMLVFFRHDSHQCQTREAHSCSSHVLPVYSALCVCCPGEHNGECRATGNFVVGIMHFTY